MFLFLYESAFKVFYRSNLLYLFVSFFYSIFSAYFSLIEVLLKTAIFCHKFFILFFVLTFLSRQLYGQAIENPGHATVDQRPNQLYEKRWSVTR